MVREYIDSTNDRRSLNMGDDREWDEFWDRAPDDDGDEDADYNDLASDIDANNHETFDNAAEWNEDEHEELIAQDTILSRSKVLEVDELEKQFLRARIGESSANHSSENHNSLPYAQSDCTQSNISILPSKRSGWSPFGGKDFFVNKPADQTMNSIGTPSQNIFMHVPQTLDNLEQIDQHRLQQLRQARIQNQNQLSHTNHQLQQQLRQQQQQQEQLLQQQILLRHQNQLQQTAIMKLQMLQQHQLQASRLEEQQLKLNHALRSTSHNPQVFTVEELERQIISNNSFEPRNNASPKPLIIDRNLGENNSNQLKSDRQTTQDLYFRHNSDRNDRYERNREPRGQRENRDRRERRDNRDRRQIPRRRFTIIPPQVQLSVLEKSKRLHSITAMHSDEFLRDRMPTSVEGFFFTRHEDVDNKKNRHDGILTDEERSWLTRIQKKIQGDYDENPEQDYYYLLYFNRGSSVSDDPVQKSGGSGVQDRRFVPRERLLYNNN